MQATQASAAPIAGRFVLQSLAGAGGMGSVYRAHDMLSGQTAAVKLLQSSCNWQDAERFTREAQLLSELRHPGIVTYLDHGTTESGEPYLAMEWLEGVELGSRLAREVLTIDEAMVLLRRVAEALAVAHARGVVHRDLKPSNLFLRGGEVERVALLDFGIARLAATSQVITSTGTIIGTPVYMAPEQARGERVVTPAADIFSLGSVLFECLTGKAPFAADQPLAALAMILFDEPPSLRQMRPELPVSIEALLGRMLAKDVSRRLPDAQALLEALDHPQRSSSSPWQAGGDEQALLSVLMATPPEGDPATNERLEELHRELADQGARLEVLADGSLVVALEHKGGAATDQAAQAARCALLLKAFWPGVTIALSTGRGLLHERAANGEVFERAAALLRKRPQTSPESQQILLDEVSRGLLELRFVVSRALSGVYTLTGEELSLDVTRPLLGKPTPCVGRDRELSMLDSVLAECIEEAAPRAILVTAPPGAGKSRLRHEFVRRLEARGDDLLVLIGRGDPLGVGSSYGLLGQALRRLCGILDGEAIELQREKLASRIGERLADDDRTRVVAFVGELCGVPFLDADDVKLRAARQDPRVMSDQLTQATLDFLRAECAERVAILMLEDLHWGDALTVKLCEAALRELEGSPVMILALARPEIEELFPNVWGGRVQRMPLRPLSKKAGEQLVQRVLGEQVSKSLVSRIVAQSEGNALFLEELIRATDEGRGGEAPATVLAMLQARIGRLDPNARRVLRAAAIFGETAWSGGIRELASGSMSGTELGKRLSDLFREEILEERRESRFPGEREVTFRHALMRDATYELLVDADRREGHRLAGAYLERIGERDPLVLAEHYQLGGADEDAVRCYARGAKELFERHDLPGVLRCCEAAAACGASGADQGFLGALRAAAYFWMDDPERSVLVGSPIVSELPAGSYPWCRLVGMLLPANAGLGRLEAVGKLGQILLEADPEDDSRAAYVEAVCNLSNMFCWFGQPEKARACLARIDVASAPVLASDPIARGWACFAHGFHDYLFGHRLLRALQWASTGIAAFAEAGDERSQVAPEVVAGLARAALGDEDGATATLRAALARARRVGQPFPISYAEMHLAFVLGGSEKPERRAEAVGIAEAWVHPSAPSVMFQGIAHDVLARVAASGGDLPGALSHAEIARERLSVFGPYHLFALATSSTIQLALGHTEDAVNLAAPGVAAAALLGGAGEIPLRLSLVEALRAKGELDAARAELENTVQRLLLRLDDILEPDMRHRYLTSVPTNARVVVLANDWLGMEVRG